MQEFSRWLPRVVRSWHYWLIVALLMVSRYVVSAVAGSAIHERMTSNPGFFAVMLTTFAMPVAVVICWGLRIERDGASEQ